MEQNSVLVSGAAGALGQRILRAYLDKGESVVALDTKPRPDDFSDYSDRLSWIEEDLSHPSGMNIVLQQLKATGSVRLLVNAIGLIHNEPCISFDGGQLVPHSAETWEQVISANLTAPFFLSSGVASLMIRSGGGSIINMSSVSAQGITGQSAYSAAKAGLEAVTRVMNKELGPMGVRVNAIAPGFIGVPTTHDSLSDERLDEVLKETSIKRLGSVDDIIKAVFFLDDSPYICGTVLQVDGGFRGS